MKLPVEGAVGGVFGTVDYPGVVFRLEGWTTSARYLAYEPARKTLTETKLLAPST